MAAPGSFPIRFRWSLQPLSESAVVLAREASWHFPHFASTRSLPGSSGGSGAGRAFRAAARRALFERVSFAGVAAGAAPEGASTARRRARESGRAFTGAAF
jgi:hypothetical protein